MGTFDYEASVKHDVLEFIEEEIDMSEYSSREELEEYLNETLWTEDSVTGNGSGSYFFNSYKAEEAISHNLELLGEALSEFGEGAAYLQKNGAEACDVTIRCYLLPQAISAALDEVWEDPEDVEEEEENEEC